MYKKVGLDVELEEKELGLKRGTKNPIFLQITVEISVLPGPKCLTETGQIFFVKISVMTSVQPGPKPRPKLVSDA